MLALESRFPSSEKNLRRTRQPKRCIANHAFVRHGAIANTRAPPFADTDNAILLEPRIARNEGILLVYPHFSAILGESTVFCVTGGLRG